MKAKRSAIWLHTTDPVLNTRGAKFNYSATSPQSPWTKRHLLHPITSHLQLHKVPCYWGFPFRLNVTKDGVQLVPQDLQEGDTFLKRLGLPPMPAEDDQFSPVTPCPPSAPSKILRKGIEGLLHASVLSMYQATYLTYWKSSFLSFFFPHGNPIPRWLFQGTVSPSFSCIPMEALWTVFEQFLFFFNLLISTKFWGVLGLITLDAEHSGGMSHLSPCWRRLWTPHVLWPMFTFLCVLDPTSLLVTT